MTLTAADRQQKLETLAATAPSVLESTSKRELDRLVSGLIVRPRDLKKGELLAEIDRITADIRLALKVQQEEQLIAAQVKQLELVEMTAAALENQPSKESRRAALAIEDGSMINETIEYLETIGRDGKLNKLQLCEKAVIQAGKVATLWGYAYEESTIKKYKTNMNNAVADWLKTLENGVASDDIQTAARNFLQALKENLKHITIRLNDANKLRVNKQLKEKGRTFINPTALLEKATNVLEKVAEGHKPDYRDVAIALALATGRRMAEIMSAGNFEAVDSQTLAFSGTTKARKNRDEKFEQVFNIPCLVNTALVISGIQYLEDNGYRLDNVKDVNHRYAKSFSRQIEGWEKWVNGISITFKSLRALYAQVAYKRYGGNSHETMYFAEILGHDPKATETAFSYEIWTLEE